MKRLIFYSILILFAVTLIGQAKAAKKDIDNCGPNFQEVYNFNIGDVFQYVNLSYKSAGGAGLTEKTTTKYTVTSKTLNGDTITYTIDGIRNIDYYCARDEINWCDNPSKSEVFQDTLIYIDSIDHFLNKCNQEVVPLSSMGRSCYKYDLLTIIQTFMEGTNQIKKIGEHFYTYEDDSLVSSFPEECMPWFYEMYAKNLGKIESYKYWYHGDSDHSSLQGYVKNGDTTGIVTPDGDLLVSFVQPNKWENIEIYPNPTVDKIFINSNDILSNQINIELFDIRGNKILAQCISVNYLDLTFLDDGIYFLKIIADDNITTKRIIKKSYCTTKH